MVEITVLAVTRISDGVCVAGMKNDGTWVRPTRPNPRGWQQLEYSDCKDANGKWVVRKGSVVRMDLTKPIPEGARSEDWLFGDKKPELIRELSEQDYKRTCERLSEDSTDSIESSQAKRSVVLIHPTRIKSFSFGLETKRKGVRKYMPRCTFTLGKRNYPNVAITDAEWRGYGRKFVQVNSPVQCLPIDRVFGDTGTTDCWLTLGRYEVNSTEYLLIIGIHIFPVKHFEMDFER